LLYIHALSEGQLAGRFDQQLMEEIIALSADVNSNSSSGRRVKLNAIQIRAAIFAVRVGQDKVRLMARHIRKQALRTQQVSVWISSAAPWKSKRSDIRSKRWNVT
jgi:hypothetical protein